MKKQLFAAVVGAALAFPLFAQAEGYYIGGNVGRSELKASNEFGSDKAHKTGYQFLAGYEFTPNFAAEAGYIDFGKTNFTDYETPVSLKTSAFYVAGTGTLPLNAQFSLFAKAGVTRNRSKLSVEGAGNESFNKTAALFGIGAAYHFDKNLSVVAEYQNFGKTLKVDDVKVKADLLSIGLRYKF